jgi:UDP-glucose 4-epimerase
MSIKKILVTGGSGYIGSHTVVKLLEAGYEVVILDDLSNSKVSVIDRIEKITNKRALFFEGDIRDRPLLKKIFNDHEIDAVIHFAGLKAVAESVVEPLKYYENNIGGSISLLEAMKEANVKNIIFSSSATVYGEPKELPIKEDHPLNPTNPYGETKLAVENLLRDLYRLSPDWKIFILRYFNPVGAHESGLIGDDPQGIPNNLFPYIAKVAMGEFESLKVFSDDYDTKDGTGVRDYIHVVDLAEAHLKALEKLRQEKHVLKLIFEWNKLGKIIASTCHGAQLLISAKVIKDRKVSAYYSIEDDINNAGAYYVNAPFVTDRNLVTSPHYQWMGEWMREAIRLCRM